MYDNNWMGFSDPHMMDGMKEAAQQLPEIPVRKVVRKIAQQSQALMHSDCPEDEVLVYPTNDLSFEQPCK